MTLRSVQEGKEYIIKDILTNDDDLDAFLLTLGCYAGEPITVIKQRKSGAIIVIKDGRYSIDRRLSDAISVNG